MSKKDQTNEEFVRDLMNFSPYGALCQPFIIQAIGYYCQEVIKDKDKILAEDKANQEEGKISLINNEAWIGIAEDIAAKIKEKYNNK